MVVIELKTFKNGLFLAILLVVAREVRIFSPLEISDMAYAFDESAKLRLMRARLSASHDLQNP